jgi:ABC-type transport system substrate-binding protein
MKWISGFAFFLLFSCSLPDKNTRKIFRYNDASGITTLDPAFASNMSNIWAIQQLFNGLVELDSTAELRPCIAKRWEISEDRKVFTFILHPDVYFHQNPCFTSRRKVLASDIVYSFNRLLKVGNGRWITQYIDTIQSSEQLKIIALNDTVVQFTLRSPFQQFIQLLSTPYASVVPHEAIAFYKEDFGRHPVGTGPFVFKAWHENEKLILNKNPDYFQFYNGVRLPYIDGVSITFLKDPQSSLLQFIQGNLDMLSGSEIAFQQELLTSTGELKEKYSSSCKLIRSSFLNTEYIGFKIDDASSPFSNKYLRMALHQSIEKSKITKYIRRGIGLPADELVIPYVLRSDKLPIPQLSVLTVEEYLKLAGYNSADEVPEIVIAIDPMYTEIYTQIANQWKKKGFKVKLNILDRPTLKSSVSKGTVSCYRASWIADYADMENYYLLFLSSNFSPGGPNYSHYKNDQYDLFYNQLLTLNDKEQKYSVEKKMNELLVNELPVIPVYYDEAIRFMQRKITGISLNPMNSLDLRRVKINDN